jgi:hypothetical protein
VADLSFPCVFGSLVFSCVLCLDGFLLDQFLVFFELHVLAFVYVGALYGWSHVHDDTLSIDHLVHLHIFGYGLYG